MNDEIHIKIGGDHGGDSFKACYQVCNVQSPNSKDNTVIFSMFEAKDSRANVRTALNVFTRQLDQLQETRWK